MDETMKGVRNEARVAMRSAARFSVESSIGIVQINHPLPFFFAVRPLKIQVYAFQKLLHHMSDARLNMLQLNKQNY